MIASEARANEVRSEPEASGGGGSGYARAVPASLGGAGYARAVTARIAGAARLLAGCAAVACTGGRLETAVDLTPFAWTWSQVSLGDSLIRYGHPDEPVQASDAEAFALAPVGPGASEEPLASFRYGCAREDREEDSPCTVFLDFRLLEFEPPLPGVSLEAYRARFEQVYGTPPAAENERPLVRDSHGREWVHRALALESGGALAHYSRPIDARRALAVTSYTTRAPDRVAARGLAREAIDRALFDARSE